MSKVTEKLNLCRGIMKVKDLITHLQNYDPELEVMATTPRGKATIEDVYQIHDAVVLDTKWYELPVPDRE